jgi:hypothetical protein
MCLESVRWVCNLRCAPVLRGSAPKTPVGPESNLGWETRYQSRKRRAMSPFVLLVYILSPVGLHSTSSHIYEPVTLPGRTIGSESVEEPDTRSSRVQRRRRAATCITTYKRNALARVLHRRRLWDDTIPDEEEQSLAVLARLPRRCYSPLATSNDTGTQIPPLRKKCPAMATSSSRGSQTLHRRPATSSFLPVSKRPVSSSTSRHEVCPLHWDGLS